METPTPNLLFCSRDLVLCEKIAGYGSEAEGKQPNMPSLLAAFFRERGENGDIYPVHRLDLPVGGVMVYARTKAAASRLCAAAEGGMQKRYLAAVHGRVEGEGEWRDLLFHDRRTNKTYVVDRQRAGVKEARLIMKVLDYNEAQNLTLVAVRLFTGRTHQIRAQFSSRGYPLVGDRRYGAPASLPAIGLWSYSLTLPLGKEEKTFTLLPKGEPWSFFSPASFCDITI